VNRRISSRIDDAARRLVREMQEHGGVDASFLNGPQLNNLDDWSTLRDYVEAWRVAGNREMIVPAISSFADGGPSSTYRSAQRSPSQMTSRAGNARAMCS
jgi:hypothetical protein